MPNFTIKIRKTEKFPILLTTLHHLDYTELKLNQRQQFFQIQFDHHESYQICCEILKNLNIEYEIIKLKKVKSNIPPSTNLPYNYRNLKPEVIKQIFTELKNNPQFLVQTLHLMNKFNCKIPKSMEIDDDGNKEFNKIDVDESDEDSEIEETMERPEPVEAVPSGSQFKRKSNLPKITIEFDRKKKYL